MPLVKASKTHLAIWLLTLLAMALLAAFLLAYSRSATRRDPIHLSAQALNINGNSGDKARLLGKLRGELIRMPRTQAVKSIQAFLDSGDDVLTGQEFSIGNGGFLNTSPTLRVFLLDYLPRIDPAAAAEYARTVLSRMDSADEWAVSLRNLARASTNRADRDYLEVKLRQLWGCESWRQKPSIGYLEAFDLAVYLGRTNLVPDLAHLMQSRDNPAVAHASFLALDRLVISRPAEMLALLLAKSGLMEGREDSRAGLFARADVQDARQRQVLEDYLLSPNLGEVEWERFAGLYPNANYMVSRNLLTQTSTPNGAVIAGRDAAASAVVTQWLADPRFDSRKPQLLRLQKRLEEFVRQTNLGP
jgi:hypothetical protein